MSAPGAGPGERSGRRWALLGGMAGAALLIAAVTALSRVVGFGRWLVFSHTVAATCVGDAYSTANQVPNIILEVVAGGALASAVVPLLAGPLSRGDRDEAGRIASALLTWALLVLVPVTLIALLAAGPAARALLDAPDGCPTGTYPDTVGRMLLIFLPQIPLYGVAVVLTGILQAGRRFLAPALAPLLSSLVVMAAYTLYGGMGGTSVGTGYTAPELVLTVGTTLGVVVLAASLVPALRGGGGLVRLRPTLRFPPGVLVRARTLALAGLATLVAQQLAVVAVIGLSNHRGAEGTLVVYNLAWAVYLLPYAVLAVPIATSVFPGLATRADQGDDTGYARLVAVGTRTVLLVSCAGAGLLAATATPMARVFLAATESAVEPSVMAAALLGFAPGLVGYGLVAHLGRALYAANRGRAAGGAIVLGWAGVVVADVALVFAVPPGSAVIALGVGNSVGMTLAGVLLLAAVRRAGGVAALAGLARAGGAGIAGALLATAAGVTTTAVLGLAGVWGSALEALAAALPAGAVYAGAVWLLDRDDLRSLRTSLTRRRGGV